MGKFILALMMMIPLSLWSQDSVMAEPLMPDTVLQFVEPDSVFNIHVDSLLTYKFDVAGADGDYLWYLKGAPAGLRINRETGQLAFRADRAYFLSGRLRYDQAYRVVVGLQSRNNPSQKLEHRFTISFFNTEVIPARVKTSVSGTVWVDEGESVQFTVLCETGSFPIDEIITATSVPITGYQSVQACGQTFKWTPAYNLVREADSGGVRLVDLSFIGSNRFKQKDTARVRLVVRNALNYPQAVQEHAATVANVQRFLVQAKYSFLVLDSRLKRSRGFRTGFDVTSATTSLTGTVLAAGSNESVQKTGRLLPGVGLSLVPIKEAVVPNKVVEQNQASLLRSTIKRLEYLLTDNALVGEKDADVARKTAKLKEELKNAQLQLIDVPLALDEAGANAGALDAYFNSPKVNKKYRLRKR